ncbi:acyl-CoA dehydrogenase family protein [Pendulispora brunnea]|uniref:Acyl-CoA dehydrogenase family protein n=1 Tax=Pendulispora brunnea TaxID=2905690 RepID=A0ABZ2K3C6_9BACT
MAAATTRRKPSTFERVARGPLRLLTHFGGAEIAEKLRLRGPAAKILYHGAKTSMRAATTAANAVSQLGKKPAARLKPSAGSALFDPTPTEEQTLMRDTMRRFADEVLRPAAYAADEATKTPDAIFEQAHALGLAQLAIPEALGGMAESRSHVAGALIAEQLARGDMGLALAILAPLAVVNALVDWGTAEQQEIYLTPFLKGEAFVPAALALLEPRPLFDPMQPRTGAVRSNDGGWVLHGEKSLVPLAESATLFAVVADVRGRGPQVFLVDRATPGLTVQRDPAMGLRAAGLGRLRLDNARVPSSALLGGDGGSFDIGALVDRARIAWGAMAVGTGQAILDYVIPYCNDRQAFGEPVSHRQSVAFLIADMAIELEGMRLLVHRAASLSERGGDVAHAAALARTQCANKGMKIGTDGVQLLGGHGFVKEHPVERWYRDLRAIAILEGALSV